VTHLTTDLARNSKGMFEWTINKSPMSLNWSSPTVFHPDKNKDEKQEGNIYECGYDTPWVFVLIDSGVDISHPVSMVFGL
jgi:hypothetical protein